MRFQVVITLIFLSALYGCSLEKDAQKEAICKAEEFVIEQGYAYEKINLDSTTSELDVNERSILSKKQISEWRHNTLIPEAVYVKKQEEGWVIGFKYTENEYWDSNTTVIPIRQVIVYYDGIINMRHEDIIIDKDSLMNQNAR